MKKLLSGLLTLALSVGLLVVAGGAAQAVSSFTPSYGLTGDTSPGTFTITEVPIVVAVDQNTCGAIINKVVDFNTSPVSTVTGTITVTPNYVTGKATVSGAIPAFATETLNVDVDVTFTTQCDSSTQNVDFTFLSAFDYLNPPNITSISPTAGTSGTTVTITGTDLADTTAVKFGTANALSFNVVSDTSITAIAPAGVGSVNVSVTSLGATDSYASFTYTQLAISSVSPGTGDVAGGQTVTITGSGFDDDVIVYFGTTPGTAVDSNVAGTQLTVVTPAKSAGVVDIVISDGTSTASLLAGFRFVADPTITDFSPKSGPLQGGTVVTISGTNFYGDSDELLVLFGTAAATEVTPAPNGQSMTVMVPAKAAGDTAAVKVTVTNKAGSVISTADFVYAVHTVTSVSPQYGPVGGGNIVTITGTNLLGASEVKFGIVASPNILSVTNTQITAVAPAGSGTVDVSVKVGTASVAKQNAYTYLTAPSVTAITPNVGALAGGTTVTITGTNLKAITKIEFGVNQGTSVVINSAGTSLTVVTPSRVSVGLVNVTLTGPGGVTIVPNGFEYVQKVCVPAELGKIRFAKGSSVLTDAAKTKLTNFSSAIIASGCDIVTIKRYKTSATTSLQKAMADLTSKRVKKALKYLQAQLDTADIEVTIERIPLSNQKTAMTTLDQFKVNRRVDFAMKS